MRKQNDKEDPLEDAIQKCKEEMQETINKINRNLLSTIKTLKDCVTAQDEEIARLKQELEVRSKNALKERDHQPSVMEDHGVQALREDLRAEVQALREEPYGCQMHWEQCRGYRELKTEKNQSITRNYRGWLCSVLVKLWWNRNKDSDLLRIPFLQTVLGRVLHCYAAQIPSNRIETAGYRMDGYREEGSSSQDRQSIPTVHEVGEGSSQAEEGFPHAAFSIIGTASPGTMFGDMQNMVPNPMYANIGMQPRFWGTQGQFGVSQGNLGMAGFSIPPVNMTPRHQHVTGQGVQMAPTSVPIMQIVSFDNLESMDKPKLKLPESWRIHNAFHVSLLRPYVGDVLEDMPVEDQPEVEEPDEILVPEQILAHKERKVKGKVARRYLVKFRNYPPMDAKWMEEGELPESPTVLSLYLEAFGLQPTLIP
ncbi:hypothetical protein L7F22_053431 [Adiantum nelumboides]|nr:hypothetical protein [Adiantum nelumboides]